MALKPTIYKARVSLVDLDRDLYESLSLTLAQHPSETIERMMVRLVVYCIYWHGDLAFTKGLSAVEEPDLWIRTLDDTISLWVDVGEPAAERIKKATRLASKTVVVCFNSKSDVWWNQNKQKFDSLNVSVKRFAWDEVSALPDLVQRTMELTLTVSEGTVYLSGEKGDCELSLTPLK
ncbi:MAG: YaeQ family protein [Pseudomonadales bacterium]